MKLLIDVDALVKMAHWRMLPELPGSLDISWSNCATVSSLKFRASRAATEPDGKLFISTQAAQAAVLAIAEMSELAEPLPGHLELFQDISGIDAGEAILFAGIMGDDSTYVLTGDKRALRALSNLPAESRMQMAGRIYSLEQILLVMLQKNGLGWLRDRVCPERKLDKAVDAIMGSRCDAPAESVREGFASYIRELASLYDPSLLVVRM